MLGTHGLARVQVSFTHTVRYEPDRVCRLSTHSRILPKQATNHVDRNGGPTPRRRSAARAPSTRHTSHSTLSHASTQHTIPHAPPPTDRPKHSTALPPTFSTLDSNTHNPCTHTPTTCLRAETSGLPVRLKKTQARTSRRTDKTTSRTSSSNTTSTTTWRQGPFRAHSTR